MRPSTGAPPAPRRLATPSPTPCSTSSPTAGCDRRNRARADLERVFARELEALAANERRRTVALLDVLCGPETWETLNLHHDLDVDSSTQCVADAIVLYLRQAGS